MKAACLVLLVALGAAAAERRPLGRLLRQATGGIQMSTAIAEGGPGSSARTFSTQAADGETASGFSTSSAKAVNGDKEGRARAVTSQLGFASNTRTGSFALSRGVQIASGSKDASAYGTIATGVSGALPLAEAFGGADANNWPAAYGYGQRKKAHHHKKEGELVQEPAEAFVLTSSWAVNGRH